MEPTRPVDGVSVTVGVGVAGWVAGEELGGAVVGAAVCCGFDALGVAEWPPVAARRLAVPEAPLPAGLAAPVRPVWPARFP